MTPFHTRFAPSPTGPLHRAHLCRTGCPSFCQTNWWAFTLRIDDIDHTRCRDQFTKAIYDDLRWLGLTWEEPVPFQTKARAYQTALQTLQKRDLVYPCFLSRKELADILSAPWPPCPSAFAIPTNYCQIMNNNAAPLVALRPLGACAWTGHHSAPPIAYLV